MFLFATKNVLVLACESGDRDLIEEVLACKDIDINVVYNKKGVLENYSGLHAVAQYIKNDSAALVKKLLNRGADLNQKNKKIADDGGFTLTTPLAVAILCKNYDAVQALLAVGAKPLASQTFDKNGILVKQKSIWNEAVQSYQQDIMKCVYEKLCFEVKPEDYGRHLDSLLINNVPISFVEDLLSKAPKTFDIDQYITNKFPQNITSMTYFAKSFILQNKGLSYLFLEKGADPNKGLEVTFPDEKRYTNPFYFAISTKDRELIEKMLEKGATTGELMWEMKGEQKIIQATALSAASYFCPGREIIEMICKKGGACNQKIMKIIDGKSIECTPLFLALMKGNVDGADCLIEHGANIKLLTEEQISIIAKNEPGFEQSSVKWLTEKGLINKDFSSKNWIELINYIREHSTALSEIAHYIGAKVQGFEIKCSKSGCPQAKADQKDLKTIEDVLNHYRDIHKFDDNALCPECYKLFTKAGITRHEKAAHKK